MSDPTPPPRDDAPHAAASDPPLSLQARTPGPRGHVPRKIGFAALGLIILFAMAAAAWSAAHYAPKAPGEQRDSEVSLQR
jgi:hypothetical protein